MRIDRPYPRELRVDGAAVRFALLEPGDRERLLALGRSVPEHDQLFLHGDITREETVDAWIGELERGELATVLAERDGDLLGYATIQPERDPWSQHVAELRVVVAPRERGRGLGRILTQEAFALALSAGIEKIVARMTADQDAAFQTFEGLGFRPEAMLRDHVKDRQGKKHDLVVLSHDVERFHAKLEAYGVTEAFDE